MSFVGLIVGTVAAAGIGAIGSVVAGGEQAGASEQATAAQQQMYQQQLANEAPYAQGGQGALAQLNYLEGNGNPTGVTSNAGGYGSLNAPFTEQTFQQYSPAYQFQLQQGQQGVLNTDSSSQGALSGAALKDLTGYNQSYANTAFNNAFNQYQTQNQNVYGRLAGIANLGEAAASNQATGGSNYAQGIGQSITNTGSALGGGVVGAANSIGNAGLLGALYGGSSSSFSPYGIEASTQQAMTQLPDVYSQVDSDTASILGG
jgi:hypothetical protein